MTTTTPPRLMLVVGEPSGYTLAVKLIEALRVIDARVEVFGATGASMRAAGVESSYEMDDLARIGLTQVARALPQFWQAFKHLQKVALERQPDAVIFIDYPEFNLRLARALHRRNLKTIYYVSPQLWGWRSSRAAYIKNDVDLLLSILPFEVAWYKQRGIHHVEFIGHPLVGAVKPTRSRNEFLQHHNLNSQHPIISLLPGSRRQELARHTPLLLSSANLILQHQPHAQFIIPLAPHRSTHDIKLYLEQGFSRDADLQAQLRVVDGATYDALHASDAAAVTSGTATLEAALLGTPHAVVYRESKLNWHTLGKLIEIDTFALPNLIAERHIVKEFIQNDFTPANVATEILRLLEPSTNRQFRLELARAVARLGTHGASTRAAELIIDRVSKWRAANTVSAPTIKP